MNKEFFEALEELRIEKGISKEYLLDAIESALLTAYKKNFNAQENVKIVIDEEKASIKVYSLKEVVEEFNGEETTLESIRESLRNNPQEVVIVAEEDNTLVGFVCVQLKKSFCYEDYMPEITEVYVMPEYRNRGIASNMILFAEEYCSKKYQLHKYELLTGKKNVVAQTVYGKLGYTDDGEMHMVKRV